MCPCHVDGNVFSDDMEEEQVFILSFCGCNKDLFFFHVVRENIAINRPMVQEKALEFAMASGVKDFVASGGKQSKERLCFSGRKHEVASDWEICSTEVF